jgi:hypothetical protein
MIEEVNHHLVLVYLGCRLRLELELATLMDFRVKRLKQLLEMRVYIPLKAFLVGLEREGRDVASRS